MHCIVPEFRFDECEATVVVMLVAFQQARGGLICDRAIDDLAGGRNRGAAAAGRHGAEEDQARRKRIGDGDILRGTSAVSCGGGREHIGESLACPRIGRIDRLGDGDIGQSSDLEGVAAGVQLHHRSAVGRVRAVTRMHHAEVIDTRGDVREQLADPQTALAILPEPPRRTQQVFG